MRGVLCACECLALLTPFMLPCFQGQTRPGAFLGHLTALSLLPGCKGEGREACLHGPQGIRRKKTFSDPLLNMAGGLANILSPKLTFGSLGGQPGASEECLVHFCGKQGVVFHDLHRNRAAGLLGCSRGHSCLKKAVV